MRISDWSSDVCSSDLLERCCFFSLELDEGGVGCQGLESATLASTSHRRIEHITAVEIILPSKRPIEASFLTRRCQLRERAEDRANGSRAKRVPEYERVFLLLRVTAASQIGRASCGERVGQSVLTSVLAV